MELKALKEISYTSIDENAGAYGSGTIKAGEVIRVRAYNYNLLMRSLEKHPDGQTKACLQIAQKFNGEYERLGVDSISKYASDSYIDLQDLNNVEIVR